MTSRWVTLLILDLLKGLLNDDVGRQYIVEVRFEMAFWKTIGLRYAGGDHRRSLHGGRSLTRTGTERIQNNNGHRGSCGLETPTYDGSANFDFYNVSFKSYANTARQSYADCSCGSHDFDCARANESRYNCQAPRREGQQPPGSSQRPGRKHKGPPRER